MTLETQSTPAADARRARRAIGAMFFTAFGGAWLAMWADSEFTPAWPCLARVAVPNVLNHIGRSELILPMIIFVVGAHCLWPGLGPPVPSGRWALRPGAAASNVT